MSEWISGFLCMCMCDSVNFRMFPWLFLFVIFTSALYRGDSPNLEYHLLHTATKLSQNLATLLVPTNVYTWAFNGWLLNPPLNLGISPKWEAHFTHSVWSKGRQDVGSADMFVHISIMWLKHVVKKMTLFVCVKYAYVQYCVERAIWPPPAQLEISWLQYTYVQTASSPPSSAGSHRTRFP